MSLMAYIATVNLCLLAAMALIFLYGHALRLFRVFPSPSTQVRFLRFGLFMSLALPLASRWLLVLSGEPEGIVLFLSGGGAVGQFINGLGSIRAAASSFAALVAVFALLQVTRLAADIIRLRRILARSPVARRIGRLCMLTAPADSSAFAVSYPAGSAIVLPGGLPRKMRRLVTLHELVHLRNADPAWNWFAGVVAIFCAWNPAFRLWLHLHGHWCERTCDEAVLSRHGSGRADYLDCLLFMAGSRQPATRQQVPVTAMLGSARFGRLSLRNRIFNITRPVGGRSVPIMTWIGFAALLVAMTAISTVDIRFRSWSVHDLHRQTIVNLGRNALDHRLPAFGLVMGY